MGGGAVFWRGRDGGMESSGIGEFIWFCHSGDGGVGGLFGGRGGEG